MTVLDERYTLSNGVQIPKIGFGTWQIPDGADAYDAVALALRQGYRHIDTARAYGNETSVGRAVRDSGIARGEIFVTSKLPAEVKTYDGALASFEATAAALDLGPLDLYLIHAPWPWNERGADYRAGNQSGVARDGGVLPSRALPRDRRLQLLGGRSELAAGRRHGHADGEPDPLFHRLDAGRSHPILPAAGDPDRSLLAARHRQNPGQRDGRGDRPPVRCQRAAALYPLHPGARDAAAAKSTHQAYIAQNADVDFAIAPHDLRVLDSLRDTV